MSRLKINALRNTAGTTDNLTLNADGSVSTLGAKVSPFTGFKNRIINGDMRIDQRNAGASVTASVTNTDTYTIDRWCYYATQASKFTVQQNAGGVTPPPGYSHYLGVTSTAATTFGASDIFLLRQYIEGFNAADLEYGTVNAVPVTLSFLVRSSLTGTFTGSVVSGSSSNNYPFTYTITSANTWQAVSVVIPANTLYAMTSNTNGLGVQVNFALGVGSSGTNSTNAWSATGGFGITGSVFPLATNGATFYVTGVQLEKGSVATEFERRDYGRELAMCERYYQIVVGAAADNGAAAGTKVYYVPLNFKTTMRAAPTATFTPVLSTLVGSRAVEAQTVNGGRYVVVANGGGSMFDTSNVALSSEL